MVQGQLRGTLDIVPYTVTHSGAAGNEDLTLQPSAGVIYKIYAIQFVRTDAGTVDIYYNDGTLTAELMVTENMDAGEVGHFPGFGLQETNESGGGFPILVSNTNYITVRFYSVADTKVCTIRLVCEIFPE